MKWIVAGAVVLVLCVGILQRNRQGVPKTGFGEQSVVRTMAVKTAGESRKTLNERQPTVSPVQSSGPGSGTKQPSTARVSGRVLDPEQRPVPSVLVTVTDDPDSSHPTTTTTDAEGAYAFDDVAPGNVTIEVHPEQSLGLFARPSRRDIVVTTATETTAFDFNLERGLTIAGFVKDKASEPVEDAFVEATASHELEAQTSSTHMAYTDAAGFFEVTGIHPATKRASVRAGASGYRQVRFEPQSPFTEPQAITLEKLAELKIVVSDAVETTSTPRFRYRITSERRASEGEYFRNWSESTLLSQPGEAEVRDIPDGKWQVLVEELSSVGRLTGRSAGTIVTLTGTSETVRLAFGPGNLNMYGAVVDAKAERLAGATIHARPYTMDGRAVIEPARSNVTAEDGTFEIIGLQPGLYEVRAVAGDRSSSPQLVQLAATGEGEPVIIQMP